MSRLPTVLAERFLHVMGCGADFQIGIQMRLSGRLLPDILAQALTLSLSLYPHLACRLAPGWNGSFLEQLEISGKDILRVAWPGSEKDAEDFFCSPMDELAGPLVQCLLVRGKNDTLCLKLSHVAADAGGVKAFAYFLAGTYKALAKGGPLPCPPPYYTRSFRLVADRFGPLGRLRFLKRALKDLAGNPPWPGPFTIEGRAATILDRKLATQTLGRELCARIGAWTKAINATLNDVCMAAFLRALEKRNKGKEWRVPRIIVTADMRRFLDPGQQDGLVCNLSGWVPLCLGKTMGQDLDQATRKVSNKMNALKKDCLGMGVLPVAGLVSGVLPLPLSRSVFKAVSFVLCSRRLMAPSLTNMGRINEKALDFGHAACEDAFLLAPVVYAPVMGVGISGFRGTLTLSMGYTSPGFDPGQVKAFLKSVVEELEGGVS